MCQLLWTRGERRDYQLRVGNRRLETGGNPGPFKLYRWGVAVGLLLAVGLLSPPRAPGNGGPFVIKYPGGDPAAKGVLARLDPSLKPAREERLRVIREELSIAFAAERTWGPRTNTNAPALARVTARYFIENPTDEAIDVSFGFPILRGVYVSPFSMMPVLDARVTVNSGKGETNAPVVLISNSAIYGLIRSRARERIEAALAGDAELQARVQALRNSSGDTRAQARDALRDQVRRRLSWNERDAALLVEYVSLDLGRASKAWPYDATSTYWSSDETLRSLVRANIGPLTAIGEQKATQLLAHLAGRFDPQSAADYEAIFAAWGGEVLERAIDLDSGHIRPREYQASRDVAKPGKTAMFESDPTIYARVDYLDENAGIAPEEKAACKTILKNLPVTFTFAPMNLLHYGVAFAPKAQQTVTVSYSQYAYVDTRAPESYQVAYVVQPASFWKSFGPIRLTVLAPEGVRAAASVPLQAAGTANVTNRFDLLPTRCTEYDGEVTDKVGELFVGIDAAAWREHVTKAATGPQQAAVNRKP